MVVRAVEDVLAGTRFVAVFKEESGYCQDWFPGGRVLLMCGGCEKQTLLGRQQQPAQHSSSSSCAGWCDRKTNAQVGVDGTADSSTGPSRCITLKCWQHCLPY
jgi:hypothetical protein